MQLFPTGGALVFGGSGGIGRAVALGLATAGANVALTYRSNKEAARQAVDAIRAQGASASMHSVDVTNATEVNAAISDAISVHARIHTLVWAAGPLVAQELLSEMTFEQWKKAIDVELNGFFAVCKEMIPHFRANGGGSFVTLGAAGHSRWPQRDGLSVAPKAAIESLLRGIAVEEGRHNIRANSVLVGVIEAGMFLELLATGVFDDAWVENTKKMLPLARWGKPEEIADAVVFLASNKASYVTGQAISVSGGYGL